jgi:hypothetical protein
MDTPIVVALIGAGGAIGAAIVGLYKRTDRKEPSAPPTIGFDPGEASETIAAYEIEEISFSTTLSADGSTESIRQYRGVRARAAGTVLQDQEIPYKVNSSGGTFGATTVRDVNGLPTQLRIANQTPQLIDGSVMLLGLLRSDSPTDFDISQPAKGMFLMTRQEVAEAYKAAKWKTEYYALTTAVTTKVLKIAIKFPPTFQNMGKPGVVVFGDLEEVNRNETDRLKNALTLLNATDAILTVPDPIVGLNMPSGGCLRLSDLNECSNSCCIEMKLRQV